MTRKVRSKRNTVPETIDQVVKRCGVNFLSSSRMPIDEGLVNFKDYLMENFARQLPGQTYVYVVREDRIRGVINIERYARGV